MLQFDSPLMEVLFWCVVAFAAVVLLFVGYHVGRWIATARAQALLQQKEQDLFTAQKGFKQLYETEMENLKAENARLIEANNHLTRKIEEYRRKAAGFGGLFSSGGKRADAMYALLLENEALEEALHRQNEKLSAERSDALKESLRNTSYRRVLMSQLLNDDRIKNYVSEIINDDARLPSPQESRRSLPHEHEDHR